MQSACIGSGQTENGDAHIHLGSSAWVCAVSENETRFKNGVAAIQSADPDKNLVVGITEAAGSNIKWIADQFFKDKTTTLDEIFKLMNKQIESIPAGSDCLICTPWMLGERCPISDTTTRATVFNISPEHTKEHFLKAVYEGVGYNLRWILENLEKDYKIKCDSFNVIGGGALDESWLQIISDITNVRLCVVDNPRNAGAIGAGIIAMIGLGHLKDFNDAKRFVKIHKTYTPNTQNREIYNKLFSSYKDIYLNLASTYKKLNSKRFS